MKFAKKMAVAAVMVSSLFVTSAMAGNAKSANVGEAAAPTASSAAVEDLRTAGALVRYGDANKDALSLITAARIFQQVGASASTAEAVATSKGESKPDKRSVDALLARAKEYANGRKDLLALVDDVAKSGARGAVRGPGRTTTVVSRNATDVFRVRFEGGEPAMVLVNGDGDSDLDLFILDENDNEVCRDDDRTDTMICEWTPRWTGLFTIRVKNLGMANRYDIAHN